MERPLRCVLLALNSPGYRSLALGYLRAYAKADSALAGRVAFETLDLDTDVDPWWVAWRVLGLEPDVLGISVTCWNARHVYEVCRIVASVRPECAIVLGGPEVGPDAEDVLARHPEVRVVVRGEGEVTFASLLAELARGGKAWRVDGITLRKGDEVVSTADRALVANLDDLPSPYLTGVLAPVDGGAYLETYRGCPHRCAYCFEGKGYGRIRSFSDARIAAEIDAVATAPGMSTFSFIDPVFNLTDERLAKLAGWMAPHVSHGVRLHTIEVDIERIDAASAATLRAAGVASVETGPQTVGGARARGVQSSAAPREVRRGRGSASGGGHLVRMRPHRRAAGRRGLRLPGGPAVLLRARPGQGAVLHAARAPRHRVVGAGRRARAWSSTGEPPHEVIATPDVGFRDLRRAEVLASSLQSVYRARL